jgi:hypothetical protein
MSQYRSIVTLLGQAMVAEAIREGTDINIDSLAVGDADYEPSEAQTALMHEQARVAVNEVSKDADNPRWVRISAVIPPAVGGWVMTEVGVFTANGNLFAVGKLDGSYKPVYADGMVKEIAIDVILEITSEANVVLVADPHAIIATRSWVRDLLDPIIAGLTVLVNAKAPWARKIDTTAPLKGGGDLSQDRTLTIDAGTETAPGALELATAAETIALADDKRAVHPKGLKALFDQYDFLSKLSWAVLTAVWPRQIPLPWFGLISAIPAGWQLCDGTGGSPDLRGRFVVGAGGTYAVGASGGAETHLHDLSGSTGSTALTVTQMPVHGHTLDTSSGTLGVGYTLRFVLGGMPDASAVMSAVAGTPTTTEAGGGEGHEHSLPGNTVEASGLPPYYALAWICRIAG